LGGEMAAQKLEAAGLLTPMLEAEELRSAYRRRRDVNNYQKVPSGDERKYLPDGWLIHKPMQSHVWMKKPKSAEVMLEDRLWSLFFRMG
jgi:hypothetical protein